MPEVSAPYAFVSTHYARLHAQAKDSTLGMAVASLREPPNAALAEESKFGFVDLDSQLPQALSPKQVKQLKQVQCC